MSGCDAYDNAAMETVWSTIKREIAWIRGSIFFATRDEASALPRHPLSVQAEGMVSCLTKISSIQAWFGRRSAEGQARIC